MCPLNVCMEENRNISGISGCFYCKCLRLRKKVRMQDSHSSRVYGWMELIVAMNDDLWVIDFKQHLHVYLRLQWYFDFKTNKCFRGLEFKSHWMSFKENTFWNLWRNSKFLNAIKMQCPWNCSISGVIWRKVNTTYLFIKLARSLENANID